MLKTTTHHEQSSSSEMTMMNHQHHSPSSTSTSKQSILGDLPVFNAKNFSKPNPRSHLNPPKLIYTHSKPKQIVTTDRTSLLQRHFEKLHLSANNNGGQSSPSVGSSSSSGLSKRNATDSSISTTPYDRPTKTLKYN
ncbi:hypothetical protein FDP41_012916 [Naegleria fowleri]|uniref:DET1- and DDB1-associated protein 1 domain-containing protein n=1 Tax=Naegleria fowleri TaxID=5763 RepID=A0A6A5C5K8_NAEFO|nr:uncharacterized protein FDP41_012916 [Naegleria fowleri]KAF0981128.1 hypothetical protein FDP41_012916 [Naegleria fowleri]CAG4712002.1 unnamed protein product [Naegleria fowleri]